jgi:hypothetical protein
LHRLLEGKGDCALPERLVEAEVFRKQAVNGLAYPMMLLNAATDELDT